MNCVNHSDRQQVAFCQHCGRPVCKECVRRTGTAVFCTGCWTPRATTPPPASFTGNPPAGVAGFGPAYPPPVAGEPSPALAALLGFIPGVGAMYNGQYTKGIAHLIVFAMLIALTNQKGFFVIFIVGWTFYMAIEAYHTASAHRDGRPLPDPFGFNQIPEWFGIGKTTWQGFDQHPTSEASSTSVPGATPTSSASGAASTPPFFKNSIVDPMPTSTPFVPYYRRFPSGAVWLILLGTFFLLNNVGLFHFFHTRFFEDRSREISGCPQLAA